MVEPHMEEFEKQRKVQMLRLWMSQNMQQPIRSRFKPALKSSLSLEPFLDRSRQFRMAFDISDITSVVGDNNRGYAVVQKKEGKITRPMELFQAIEIATRETRRWNELNS